MGREGLQALHGLLEDGCAGLDGVAAEAWHRTGFIGISNWALDPAKMNRGIFLARPRPDIAQLIQTAQFDMSRPSFLALGKGPWRCICDEGRPEYVLIQEYIPVLTKAYLRVYDHQDEDYEFFGLRDFYQSPSFIPSPA